MNIQKEFREQCAPAKPNFQDCEKVDHRETNDNYRGELFRYGRFRIITCKDSIQWILQRDFSGPERLRGSQWRAIAYCTTRKALARLWDNQPQSVAADFSALPENFSVGGEAA